MEEKLAKFGLKIESFNLERMEKMSFKEFQTLFKNRSVIGENLKEIYAIFRAVKK